MKPLFDLTKLNDYKSSDILPFECEFCQKTFYIEKKFIKSFIKLGGKGGKNAYKYCSKKCYGLASKTGVEKFCTNCGQPVYRSLFQYKKSKTNNIFCDSSCAAKYNNAHKETGTRRSKLEVWLETQLTNLYPNLEILFNSKTAINSELDIHIPSMKIAFELNGIFHYEPIYGQEKLASIQNNDKVKIQACLTQNITLHTIDVSKLIYFRAKDAQKYLDIVVDMIEQCKKNSCP